mmetsp:Transcript_142647/g.397489  ORF Transcript_142647/g.397489 Transcript_142647/m.397489 type:complete len:234 (+) Transcript_142647:758-1459(+)
MFLLPFRDEALVETPIQACAPIKCSLTSEFLVRIDFLVQHCFIDVAPNATVSSECDFIRSSGQTTLDDLGLSKDEVPVLLDILLANEVLRHQKAWKFAAIAWRDDQAAVAQESILPVDSDRTRDMALRVVRDADHIALLDLRTHMRHHVLGAVLFDQEVVHGQRILVAACEELEAVQSAPIVGTARAAPPPILALRAPSATMAGLPSMALPRRPVASAVIVVLRHGVCSYYRS